MQPQVIFVVAFLSTVAIVLSILACTINTSSEIPANWWPMFAVATYALAPFPVVILGKNEEASQLAYWAHFTTGWIVAVSFGIPCILTHSAVIAIGNCLISLASSLIFYGTIIGLAWWQASENADLYALY